MCPLVSLLFLATSSLPVFPLDRPRIEPVEAAVSHLAPPPGITIRVAPELRGALVYLAPNGVGALESMRALAASLHASVVIAPREWTLQIGAEDARSFDRARVSERASWIQSKVDEVVKYRSSNLPGRSARAVALAEVERAFRLSERLSEGVDVERSPHFPSELLPAESLLLALVAKVGKDRLAAVPVGAVGVWEDAPVAGARPLPAHPEASAAYEESVGEFRGAFVSPAHRFQIEELGLGTFFADWAEESHPVVRLRVQVRSETARMLVSLEGYDASGVRRTTATLIAMPTSVWKPPTLVASEAAERPGGAWLTLSPSALAVASTKSTEVIDTKRSAPRWFTDPESNEPLDLAVGEALDALEPRVSGRCVAIQASDGLWNDESLATSKGRLSLAAFRTMMEERTRYERVESAGRVVWRLRNTLGRSGNADRRAMGSFARAVLRTGVIDLRETCVYHKRVGAITDLAEFWQAALRTSPAVRSFSGGASHAFYAMLGAIPDASWDALGSGAPSTIDGLDIDRDFAALLDEDRTPVISSAPFPDVLAHPRESFADGQLGAAVVARRLQRVPLLGNVLRGGAGSVRWSDGVPLPSPIEMADDPPTASGPTLTREKYKSWLGRFLLQTGYQDSTEVTIRFSNGLSQAATFTDPVIPTSAPSTFDSLSSDMQDSIWERARRAFVP